MKALLILLSLAFTAECCIRGSSNAASSLYQPDGPIKAMAILRGSTPDGNNIITGTVTFSQQDSSSPLNVTVNISGLPKSAAQHGFHVHESAPNVISSDIATFCNSAGAHFNPANVTHGDINDSSRHTGDYGNAQRDENGNIVYSFVDKVSTIYGPNGVLGRTVVLHEKPDDLGKGGVSASLTTGNAGARIACGVIGLVKSN